MTFYDTEIYPKHKFQIFINRSNIGITKLSRYIILYEKLNYEEYENEDLEKHTTVIKIHENSSKIRVFNYKARANIDFWISSSEDFSYSKNLCLISRYFSKLLYNTLTEEEMKKVNEIYKLAYKL